MFCDYFPAHQPRELIVPALDWVKKGYQIALLTLVNIEGNAPYPVGSQMLVNEAGLHRGHITGGCVETALTERAVRAIAKGQNQVERYGLNSPYFDIRLPCGSGIDVYFDVTMPQKILEFINQSLSNRQAVPKKIIFDDGAITKVYRPNARVLIFGQGAIKSSLAQLAQQTGFDVLCFENHTEGVEFLDYCDHYTALVSLFHEHDLEIPIFEKALSTDLFYLGALGSRKSHVFRLEQLAERGVRADTLAKIHGPAGLDIAATSPPQIAVSILSEVISVMNKSTLCAN